MHTQNKPKRRFRFEVLERRQLLAGDAAWVGLESSSESADESIHIESMSGPLTPIQSQVSSASEFSSLTGLPVVVQGWAESPIGDRRPFSEVSATDTPTLFGTAEPGSVITFTGLADREPVNPVVTNGDGEWQATVGPLPTNKREFLVLAIARSYRSDGSVSAVEKSERVVFRLDQLSPRVSFGALTRYSNSPITEPVSIQFADGKGNENVKSFARGDLLLTRDNETLNRMRASRNAQGEIIEQPVLTPVSGSDGSYVLEDIAVATSRTGTYELKFDASASGVVDLAGNPIVQDAKLTFAVDNTLPVFKSIEFENPRAVAANVPTSLFQLGDRPVINVTFSDQQFALADNVVHVVLKMGIGVSGTIARRVALPATNDNTLVTQNTTHTQRLVITKSLPLGTYTFSVLLQDARLYSDDFYNEDGDHHVYVSGPRQSFTFAVVPPFNSLARTAVLGDVNADGLVSSLDALLVVNRLSIQSLGEGEANRVTANSVDYRMDVNGDGEITALDALAIIKQLSIATIESGQPTSSKATSNHPWELAVDEWLALLHHEVELF